MGFEFINFKIWWKDIGYSIKNCLFIYIYEIYDFFDMYVFFGIILLWIFFKNKIVKNISNEFCNLFFKLKELENECYLISLNSYC